ncbi:MAG: acyltransferase family protein [Devosia sp.]
MEIGGTDTRTRQDIQVLRGFAVAVVLLFHLGYRLPAGGYLGVDIFFVISGYLITQIIARDGEAGRFSLPQFYFRRAKRLLPAALVMLLVTSIASFWLLTSVEMESFTKQLFGAATFTTNGVLAKETGYFDDNSATKPLLHMWSLAIEGQFYLLLPILLIRLPRAAWLATIGLVCGASLAFYLVQTQYNPDYAFYWTGTRVWELAIGGVAALLPFGSRLSRRASQVLFWPALAAILLMVARPGLVPLEGTEVVVACIATAIVILRHHPMFDAGALRPVAATGDASYSLYLTHWPVMSFFFNAYIGAAPPSNRVLVLMVGIVLGVLLYRFVETPCRGKWLRLSWRSTTGFVVSSALVMTVQAGVSYASVDLRFDYAAARAHTYGLHRVCAQRTEYEPLPQCQTTDAPEILVWGDSFAQHLVAGIVATSKHGIIQATRSGCSPYISMAVYAGNSRATRRRAAQCLQFHKGVLAHLAATPSIRLVVLSSPFSQSLHKAVFDSPDGATAEPLTAELKHKALDDTIAAIRALGRQVVVVSPPPRSQGDMGLCVERALTGKVILGSQRSCIISRELSGRISRDVIALLNHVEAEGTEVIWLADGLCRDDACMTELDSMPLYRDRGHLSVAGSVYVAQALHLGERLDALAATASASQ